MKDSVLIVEGLSKTFERNKSSLQKHSPNTFAAINDLSFELKEGEVCALMGRNGAGKTTLLELLSGILKPSLGTIKIKGRVASVIDIGTGMHPDLTGQENVFLAGNLLGLSKKEVVQKLPEIVAFSELEGFLDQAVKHYSSGMFARLAFSVITHLDADVLLIDEVIGVGDMAFSEKTVRKVQQLCTQGRTALIASHSLSLLRASCETALYLDHGKLVQKGAINEVADHYVQDVLKHQSLLTESNANATDEKELLQSEFINPTITSADKVTLLNCSLKRLETLEHTLAMDEGFDLHFEVKTTLDAAVIPSVHINYQFNQPALCLTPAYTGDEPVYLNKSGTYSLQVSVPEKLLNQGLYSVSIFFVNAADELLARYENVLVFKVVLPEHLKEATGYKGKYNGPIFLSANWKVN